MTRETAAKAAAAYMERRISDASKEELLLITYDIALAAAAKAGTSLRASDFETANAELQRAQRAVRELQFALRFERGEEPASGLMALYDFAYERFAEANVKKSEAPLGEAVEILYELKNTWEEAFVKLAEELDTRERTTETGRLPAEMRL